jgi:hypothetical protein
VVNVETGFWFLFGQTLAANGEVTQVVSGIIVAGIVGLLKLAVKFPDEAKAEKAVAALVSALVVAFCAELAKAQYNPAAIAAWPLVFAVVNTWVASMGTFSVVKRLRDLSGGAQ